MRGIASIANAVAPLAASARTPSAFVSGREEADEDAVRAEAADLLAAAAARP